jgi:hypothetical protein
MLTYIAEHNGSEVWVTNIGNAYLETFTKERVYIIAGPEFGPLEGHTLLINKAIYGLKSSGLRWSERFSDVLVNNQDLPVTNRRTPMGDTDWPI